MSPIHNSVTVDEAKFDEVIHAFRSTVDKDGNPLRMDSILVSQGTRTFAHRFTRGTAKNDLRSISKTILALALGAAFERGIRLRGRSFTLDSPVWEFFEGRVALSNQRNARLVRKITLRHLLTHTIGYDKGLLFSKDVQGRDPSSLLDYLWREDIVHEPGTHFVYSNAGPYMLSAIIQEELGLGLAEWVARYLFRPLGIVDFEWKSYGQYCAASSGLRLHHQDLHKIARILADDGRFEGRQVVPASWVSKMRSIQVRTPSMYDEARVLPKFGYGFGLWICRDGRYYCDGTDGQYLIVVPSRELVVTTLGHQPDMKPITECMRTLLSPDS